MLAENDHREPPTNVITCEMDTGIVPEIDDNELMAELPENAIHEVPGAQLGTRSLSDLLPR